MSPLPAILLIVAPLFISLGALMIWTTYFGHRIGVTPVEEPMLRAPGETQRQRIEELNEQLFERIIFITVVPIFFAYASYVAPQNVRAGLALIFGLTSFAVVTYQARRIYKAIAELRNRRLGYAGECVVAERLMPLLKMNCLIFHDCPADQHGNIDHIVVTPGMVYAIETKTRRKRLSPETQRYEAQVTYDGRSLIYPHGREDWGLDQSRRQARWLSKLLSEHLCDEVPVRPVLTLPGWMVERTAQGDVDVVNPKQLPALMRESRREPLPADLHRRMEQIRVVLEKRCRDVPFPGVETAKEAKKNARLALLKKKSKAAKARSASGVSRDSEQALLAGA
jgi:hypothetical protein